MTSDPSHPGRFRRALRGTLRFLAGMLLVLVAWALLAAILPFVPSPLLALSQVLSWTNTLYVDMRRGSLEESARKVDEQAVTSTTGKEPQSFERDSVRRRLKEAGVSSPQADTMLTAMSRTMSKTPYIRGRVINIAVVGVDSRLGTSGARADAIHLLTVSIDSGIVEIMSVPRETYCDLGHEENPRLNIITYARQRSMGYFLKRLAEVTKRGTIQYYAEVGFSQAMGIIEMLGYKDPAGTLRYLRSRKAFALGDYQRSHNQSVFLKQNLVSKFDWLTGATGDVLLMAGLRFVNTNLTKDVCQGIIYGLQKKNFPHHRSDAVRVRMVPGYQFRMQDYAADSATIARTGRRSDAIIGDDKAPGQNVTARLRNIVRLAAADTAKRPAQVVRRLEVVVDQHAWVQIQDKEVRKELRTVMTGMLERAYRRLQRPADAARVVAIREAEEVLLPGAPR